MDLGSLVPWRDKFRAPANREDIYDPFAMFRRAVDRMFDDFLGPVGGLHEYGSGGLGLTNDRRHGYGEGARRYGRTARSRREGL